MKESDLYPPLRDWLKSHGYEVHVEMFGCDIVAVKDGMITAIELKLGLWKSLREQVTHHTQSFDFVFGAFPGKRGDKPAIAGWRYNGIGCLLVDVASGRVHQTSIARRQPWDFWKRRDYRHNVLTGRAPAMKHELAGLPSCPALKEQRLRRESPGSAALLKEHP